MTPDGAATPAGATPDGAASRRREPSGRPRVVVVGAGISGLAAAWRLSRGRPATIGAAAPGGLEIVVLEATAQVGGKVRVESVGGLRLDVGAESVLARRPEALDLIAEAGLAADLVHPAVSAASVLARGRLHPLPAGTVMGVPADRSRVAGLAGLLTAEEVARAGREPAIEAPALTEDVDVASWVSHRWGRAVLERLVEPLLGGVYAGHADRLSLQATIPPLWQRARLGGPISEPTAGERDSTAPVFAGLRGGIGRLPLALAAGLRAAGVEVCTATTVRALRRTPAGWRVETRSAAAPEYLDADAVVLAVPPAAAARLLAAECPAAAAELAGIETASVAVVAAALPAEQLAGVLGSGLLIPPIEGTAIKAATFSSAKWPWIGEAGGSDALAVRLSLGRAGEQASLQRTDAELIELAVGDLARVLGRALRPVEARVIRWGGALPQYAVGHVDRVRRLRSALARDGAGQVAICGAALDGVGVAACIAAADRAVADLRASLPGAAWTIGA